MKKEHSKSVLNTEVSSFQGCPLRGVPLYTAGRRTCVSRVHGDEDITGGVQLDLRPLEQQHGGPRVDPSLDGEDLLGHHGEHLQVDSVELVEAGPRPAGGQPFEELAKGDVVQAVGAVEHHALR